MRRLIFAFAVFAWMSLSAARAADAAQPVQIPTAGFSSAPAPLDAFLFEPDTPGPHPAVVMIHGCGGAYAKDGSLNARHRMWGELYAAKGYAALMLDSFNARGIRELCTQKFADRTLKESDRVGDAYAALAWLQQQPHIDARHIYLQGWSHGAGVTLDAIRKKPAKVAQGFAAAAAFYPGCTGRNKNAEGFKPYAPLLILIGESDDWTPAAPCQALTDTARAHGAPMQIVTYPGTWHDFDNPGIKKLSLRRDVPNGVHPGQGVHTGPNADATEDAKQRVLQFFAETQK